MKNIDYDIDLNDERYKGLFAVSSIPKPVGFWIIDPGGLACTKFAIFAKVTTEQIKNTEELLGWKWEDYDGQ